MAFIMWKKSLHRSRGVGIKSFGWAIVQHNDDLSYTLLDKGVNIFQDGVACIRVFVKITTFEEK